MMGRLLVFLFPVTPYFVWKLIVGEHASDLAATPQILHQAKMFATVLEWFGLDRLDQTDLILLGMALFAAAVVFGLVTAKVFEGRCFGWFANGTIGLSGAIGSMALYANHVRWAGGADFATCVMVSFVGATMVLLIAAGLKIFLVNEASDLFSGGRRRSKPSPERLSRAISPRRHV